MLADLPPEIIYLIASHLPTASSLVNLSQACHRLHEIITTDDGRIFRSFLHRRFPHVNTPPFWKDAVQSLTSRSRALDRHAIVGRFVAPPRDALKVGAHQAIRRDNPTHGYRPAIDSYEVWDGKTWADRKEVLAWGAADRLMVRIQQTVRNRSEKWLVFDDLDHISSHDDICGVHLLKPNHESKLRENENIIFGRMRGELVHLVIAPDSGAYEYKQRFLTFGVELERTDLGVGPDPVLAAHFSNGSIAFYNTTTEDEEVQAFARLQINPDNVARNKYSKFISPSRFVVATGRLEDALAISTISNERLSLDREIGVDSVDLDAQVGPTQKTKISAVAPLNSRTTHTYAGDTFLAAWGDRAVRLHDLRSGNPYEFKYRDTSDQNPIYCVQPIGTDRFVVGAGGDAVVKIFDLRMPRTYNYLDAKAPPIIQPNHNHQRKPAPTFKPPTSTVNSSMQFPRKDLSIFLSHQPHPVQSSRRGRPQANRSYRGAIYTLSSPSPISPTLYAGIANGVVRLDFASTDDLTGPCKEWYQDLIVLPPNHASAVNPSGRVLELSGYERPDPRDTTSALKLRKQQPFKSVGAEDIANEQLTGWDRRWERLEDSGAWRRGGFPIR